MELLIRPWAASRGAAFSVGRIRLTGTARRNLATTKSRFRVVLSRYVGRRHMTAVRLARVPQARTGRAGPQDADRHIGTRVRARRGMLRPTPPPGGEKLRGTHPQGPQKKDRHQPDQGGGAAPPAPGRRG